MKTDLTPFIIAMIGLIGAAIGCFLIPWIRSRTTEQQYRNYQAIVRAMVTAAEQLYGAGQGREKLEYVCQQLEDRGYRIDMSKIEAAVYEAFNSDKNLLRPEEPEAESGAQEGKAEDEEPGKEDEESHT